jgi:multiple antibiotic resistance protein
MTLSETLAEFGKVVLALVIVLDPVALLPILVGIRSQTAQQEDRWIPAKIVGGGTVLLLFFTATGTWVLKLFDVTLDDLRIGGGLLLLLISLRMVIEGRLGLGQEKSYRAALVPLISPLLVGPGAITASVVFARVYGVCFTSLAVVAAMILCLLVLLSRSFIYRLIGESGTDLVTRIMGILVATIAVGYMRTGIIGVLKTSGGM